MLPLSILEKTETSILYEIPLGKPNPKQAWTVEEDKRDRVLQSAHKGGACWYYTFNLIRIRIGKCPPKEMKVEKAIEQLCSLRRKILKAYDEAFPVAIQELYRESSIGTLRTIDLKKAEFLLQDSSFKMTCEHQKSPDGRSSLYPYIKEFVEQKKHKNFYEYLIYKRASQSIEINLDFLRQLPSDVHKLVEHENWKKMNIDSQASCLDTYVRDVTADLYGLKKSSWQPKEGAGGLIAELQKKGPLVVLGHIGINEYFDAPYKIEETIGGRHIYAWHPNARRDKLTGAGHSVILVGANKTHVYFIDTAEPSNPKDKTSQKIYRWTFSDLTSSLVDLTARKVTESEHGFAYVGHFKV